MSHFAVLVIGENVEEQLVPYDENLDVEWVDETENYRKEYETKKVKEFYCASNSTWGFEITKELFNKLIKGKTGSTFMYKHENTPMQYLEEGKKYKGYYRLKNGKRCKRDAWFTVTKVNKTNHPDKKVCFEGVVTIRKISPPREIFLKDKYPDYNTYLEDYHGIEKGDKQGYWHNPKAKWDWYQVGGRFRDTFPLLKGKKGEKGEGMEEYVGSLYRKSERNFADIAIKGNVDWDKIHRNKKDYNEKIRFWEMVVDKSKPQNKKEKDQLEWNLYKPECYIKRYKTKENYAKCKSGFCTWAIIKDGEWIEKGSMGWFASSDETDEEAVKWELEFYDAFIKPLSDETLLTIVDCHI